MEVDAERSIYTICYSIPTPPSQAVLIVEWAGVRRRCHDMTCIRLYRILHMHVAAQTNKRLFAQVEKTFWLCENSAKFEAKVGLSTLSVGEVVVVRGRCGGTDLEGWCQHLWRVQMMGETSSIFVWSVNVKDCFILTVALCQLSSPSGVESGGRRRVDDSSALAARNVMMIMMMMTQVSTSDEVNLT